MVGQGDLKNYNQRAVRLNDRVAVAKGMQQLAGAAGQHYKAKAYVMRDGGCGRSVRWDCVGVEAEWADATATSARAVQGVGKAAVVAAAAAAGSQVKTASNRDVLSGQVSMGGML
jgi:hypothetical protein